MVTYLDYDKSLLEENENFSFRKMYEFLKGIYFETERNRSHLGKINKVAKDYLMNPTSYYP